MFAYYMYEIIKNILKKTGATGPLILMFTSFFLLWNKKTNIYYYSFGFFLNIIVNVILKGFFKQPRPLEGTRVFEHALKHGSSYKFINGLPFNVFGMPSGHAQSVFFSTIFIHFALKNKKITLFYLLISCITMYQRVEYRMHTIFQVIIGALVGSCLGYLTYFMSQRQLVGKLKLKKDDDAFVF